jgi:hypothetical protein
MERKFYTDNFEQLLKEKSGEFRMYPSKRVWHSIYNNLYPGRKWPSVAISTILVTILFLTGYWNSTQQNNSIAAANSANAASKNITSVTPAISNNTIILNAAAANSIGLVSDASFANTALQSSPITKVLQYKSAPNNPAEVAKENTKTPVIAYKTISFDAGNILSHYSDNADGTSNTSSINLLADNIAAEPDNSNSNGLFDNNNSTFKINTVENNRIENAIEQQQANNKYEDPAIAIGNNKAVAGNKKPSISAEDKAWMEHYALYNQENSKKWKNRTSMEFYIAPAVTYRTLSSDESFSITNSNYVTTTGTNSLNSAIHQRPSLGIEAGAGLVYAAAKNFRLKIGLQANYTNYAVFATETNHPVLTTLLFKNSSTGNSYPVPHTSTLSNGDGLRNTKVHNKTVQLSIPLGFAYKVFSNDKLEWYAGASIQPTYVIGGKANIISADMRNYVSDPSLIRSWNVNSAFETSVHYKFDGYTLAIGPQLRYQLSSTYNKKVVLNEKLYNVGLKIGVLKNF